MLTPTHSYRFIHASVYQEMFVEEASRACCGFSLFLNHFSEIFNARNIRLYSQSRVPSAEKPLQFSL